MLKGSFIDAHTSITCLSVYPKSTQPGQPSVGRCSEYQWKTGTLHDATLCEQYT